MVEALLLLLIVVLCFCGMAWLALAMNAHWLQVRGAGSIQAKQKKVLRGLGSASLLIAAGLCFYVNHVTMAPLVWVMAMTAGAVLVAITLTWRPRGLRFLVAWNSWARISQ